ncbi:MAG: hypothetical protein IJO98_06060 [Clostridia bacterium]|nr:hypothetical protein [Clostridia bacterium]
MLNQERELLEYLRAALPEADRIELDDAALLRIVRHAMMVREKMSWGKTIPEWIFRAFVLFPRVNDERPAFYQEYIYGELAERLEGKTMAEAALEVNVWTCERATYQITDDRTADAMTVLRRTFGRCGEESTLLVSSLRSVGIPARQVYAPRWSHCDDNHAWVEAWVDGKWWYLGACEPEPVLDSGWFTAAASKAMLVHTRAYGIEPEGERVESKVGNAYVINLSEAYAKTRLLTVRVAENGQPKSGAAVRFEIANMAELFPINEQVTDENGEVTLLTGYGVIYMHVHDGKRYVLREVDVAEQDSVEIDFAEAVEMEDKVVEIHQRSPKESRIQPSEFSEDVISAHNARLENCEALRAARIASFPKGDAHVEKAFGNYGEVEAFLADERFDETDKRALLDTLTYKDFGDLTAAMLADAMTGALPYKKNYPENIWREGVLCPRVWNEPLSESRAVLKNELPAFDTAIALWNCLDAKIERCEMTPVTLTPDLRAMLRAGKASDAALDVLFVAAARAQGIAARLNPASAEKEIWDGEWRALLPAKKADAKLVLIEKSGRELIYGVHFTIGLKEGGAFTTLHMNGTVLKGRLEIPVFAGQYRVVTCTRQIDGAYDGLLYPVTAASGETVEVEIAMQPDRSEEKLIRCELPKLCAGDGVLPVDGQEALIAVIAPGQEPTEHFLNELLDAKDLIAQRGLRVELVVENPDKVDNAKLQLVLGTLGTASLKVGLDNETLLEWRRLLNAGELRLPLAMSVDAKGRGLFAFINYNVGSVLSLIKVIEAGSEG